MKNIIQLTISKDGSQYVAEGTNLPVVTQAASLDELMDNIHEVVSLTLEGEDPEQFGISKQPSVLVNYELDKELHAA